MTSPDLIGLKQLINEAAQQRADLQPDYTAALKSRARAWRKLRRREQLPLRLILKCKVPSAQAAFEEAESEALKVAAALAQSEVRIDFQIGPAAVAAYDTLTRAHAALASCVRIWDVTSSVEIDRVRTRSVASSSVTRVPVALAQIEDSIVASTQIGLRFGNANGGDLDLFPGLLLMRERDSTDYALVDLRHLHLDVQARAFVEEEAVPSDAPVIDHAWAKANRDGSPDRRFRDNRQIPVVRYGELRFSTPDGVVEAYHVSNCDAAIAFGNAFHALQSELVRQAQTGLVNSSEVAEIDRSVTLSDLPVVRGAHELTVLAMAAFLAPLVFWHPHDAPPATSSSLITSSQASRASLAQEQTPQPSVPVPTDMRAGSGRREGQPSVIVSPTAAPDSAPQQRTAPVRVTTLRAANLRDHPESGARVLRALGPATSWVVFSRQGSWVEIGESPPLAGSTRAF
ncbi:hypothetical protein ACRBEV_26975 [Methylobacterium phyllosphaerae]